MVKPTPRQERLLKRTFLDFQQTSQFLQNPLIIERGEGLYCWDSEGKRYYDAIGGIFVAILGHRPPRVVEAMRRGARDFIQKPWDNPRLLSIVRTQVELGQALRHGQRLEAENRLLRAEGGPHSLPSRPACRRFCSSSPRSAPPTPTC